MPWKPTGPTVDKQLSTDVCSDDVDSDAEDSPSDISKDIDDGVNPFDVNPPMGGGPGGSPHGADGGAKKQCKTRNCKKKRKCKLRPACKKRHKER